MGKDSSACRVCMKKSKDNVELEDIFVRKPRITYLEGYNICTKLNALLNDGLPKNLCVNCKNELKTAYRFIEKAKDTDKKLRDKLGVNRITRSSLRIKQEDKYPNNLQAQTDIETGIDEIKTEFINCTKDPLEESDTENDEKSEDEMEIDWVIEDANISETINEKTATDENEDEDDKPLKELIKKETLKKSSEDYKNENPAFDSSDVFNDYPEPDNFSSDNEDALSDKMIEHVPDPPTTPEAQIFPQGRYMCKVCKKTYFTAEGLKAHMTVHMAKKKKVKRVRGPNKKKNKTKKKATDEDNDDDDEEHKADNESDSKKDQTIEDSAAAKVNEKTTDEAAEQQGKKKRKLKPPKPKKMFPCSVCGKHMISASKLRYHMVMHTGEKDYLCTMCPKAYSTIYALKHHMRTHTGERPYECKFCGDKFTRPTTLKSHMRRHTGERPYGCDICGKRFIQHSSMTTHMKLNHMAKTIACPQCDKKYARQTDLNTHLLSHTGDKPFACTLCPSRFIRQANLNKHMNQHHSAKSSTKLNNQTAAQSVEQTANDIPEPASNIQFAEKKSKKASANNKFQDQRQCSEANNQNIDGETGQSTIRFAGFVIEEKNPDKPIICRTNQYFEPSSSIQQKVIVATPTTRINQFAGEIMPQKISAATTAHLYANEVMQQKINAATSSNQFENTTNPNQSSSPDFSSLPRVVDVRSLSKSSLKVPSISRKGHISITPLENNERNTINQNSQMLPPQPSQSQQHVQSNIPPRSINNENSIPMSMNIAGIPGGIPTHSMSTATRGVTVTQVASHSQMGSVEHLKGIHPPVDNLTNLLGQVIDPERIGRSVDEMMPWNWSNTS